MADPRSMTIRPLETRAECEACVRLQQETWGQGFLDVVPATILMVSQRVGSVAAGAFDSNRRLMGFVFGISGVRDGRLAHWSNMLAVRPEARRSGLGKRLKCYQRELLLAHGIDIASWSYDPLVAGNADFNLNALGAVPTKYITNMYGDTGSVLHQGMDTDRLVVDWTLAAPRVRHILESGPAPLPAEAFAAPTVNPCAPTGNAPHVQGGHGDPPDAPWIRVTVPADIDALKTSTPDDARLWQLTTRQAFDWYLGHGYRVAGFSLGDESTRPWYALSRE